MSKGNKSFLLIFLFLLFLLGIVLAIFFSLIDEQNLNSTSSNFRWIKDESYLVDYQIKGDTVQFRYSMCFENYSEDTYIISAMSAEFSKVELSGWLEYRKFFSGNIEGEHHEFLIEPGEKTNVIYIFSGEYLGGTVNNLLPPPKRISYISRVQRDG